MTISNIQHSLLGIGGGVSGDEVGGVIPKLGVLTPRGGVENSLLALGSLFLHSSRLSFDCCVQSAFDGIDTPLVSEDRCSLLSADVSHDAGKLAVLLSRSYYLRDSTRHGKPCHLSAASSFAAVCYFS